ncbi:unnamed protein product [Prorocentrum cordatum]|uniref:Uncharacterized protein n=1 Tax=Prorocentrum cordatum TaxID=2364126 RepID=A0ABN9XKD5_9DINO|nr:unnamed protein product [Polarella glacialis]
MPGAVAGGRRPTGKENDPERANASRGQFQAPVATPARAKRASADAAPGASGPPAKRAASRKDFLSLLETAAPDLAGIVAEYLWGQVEERTSCPATGLVQARRGVLPEVGRLVTCGKTFGVFVITGCKERRGCVAAASRSAAGLRGHIDMVNFLERFRSLWAASRSLRLQRSDEADTMEVNAYLSYLMDAKPV